MVIVNSDDEPVLVYVSKNKLTIIRHIGRVKLAGNELTICDKANVDFCMVDLSENKEFLKDINWYMDNFLKLVYDDKKIILGKYALTKEKNE